MGVVVYIIVPAQISILIIGERYRVCILFVHENCPFSNYVLYLVKKKKKNSIHVF